MDPLCLPQWQLSLLSKAHSQCNESLAACWGLWSPPGTQIPQRGHKSSSSQEKQQGRPRARSGFTWRQQIPHSLLPQLSPRAVGKTKQTLRQSWESWAGPTLLPNLNIPRPGRCCQNRDRGGHWSRSPPALSPEYFMEWFGLGGTLSWDLCAPGVEQKSGISSRSRAFHPNSPRFPCV